MNTVAPCRPAPALAIDPARTGRDDVCDDDTGADLTSAPHWVAIGSGVSLLLYAVMRGSRLSRTVLTLARLGMATRAAWRRDDVRGVSSET